MNFTTTKESGKPLFGSTKTYAQHLMDFVKDTTITEVYTEDEVNNMIADVEKHIDYNDQKTKLQISDLKIAVKKLFKKVGHQNYYVPGEFPEQGHYVGFDDNYQPSRLVRWQLLNDFGDVVATYSEDWSLIARIW